MAGRCRMIRSRAYRLRLRVIVPNFVTPLVEDGSHSAELTLGQTSEERGLEGNTGTGLPWPSFSMGFHLNPQP